MFNLVTFLMWFCWLSYFVIPWLELWIPLPQNFENFFLYWAVGLMILDSIGQLLKLGNERVKAKESE